MKKTKTISVPERYYHLISQVVNWLGDPQSDSCGNNKRTPQSYLLHCITHVDFSKSDRALNKILEGQDFFLSPPVFIPDGYCLTHHFVQSLLDRFQFIYSPTALVSFLSQLGCLNSRGSVVSYYQVYKWPLNYYCRSVALRNSFSGQVNSIKFRLDRRATNVLKKHRQDLIEESKAFSMALLNLDS